VDQGRETVAWGCYVHVPFCATRCGYCDFNTYTASELGPGASRTSYADTVIAELRLARAHLPEAAAFDTVFFGGGTPTLLGPSDLVRILHAVRSEFGLSPMAEVTTEANPDSIDEAGLAVLREGGFTRVSFGVQSLAPQVLATTGYPQVHGWVFDVQSGKLIDLNINFEEKLKGIQEIYDLGTTS